jgi:alpha-beta hydrolase superfamily lysophospholipase
LADAVIPFIIETHTASDGYCWRYRRYSPPGPSCGNIVCIHGIQSHGGWYEYSCGRLAQAGWTVSFLDRRGAGLNQQDRGDTPGFRRLLDDIAEFIRPLTRPIVLTAISWGGKLGVAFQRRHTGLVDGLALLCPGICHRIGTPIGQRFVVAARRLVTPRKLFPIPLTDPELFTATPRWQQFIRDDPLRLRQVTVRLMVESVRLGGYLRLVARSVQVPVLLLLAGEDRIIDNARTRRFVKRFASTDQTVIEYPGAHHTLEFEPEPDRFVEDWRQWLERFGPRS